MVIAMIKLYSKHFQKKKLKIFPIVDNYIEWAFLFQGFLSSCLEKPRLTYEHTEKMDLESTAIGNERTKELKRCMYDTEAVKANLRQMIPFFDSFNVFDWIRVNWSEFAWI